MEPAGGDRLGAVEGHASWLGCHTACFARLGGVPATLRVDNEKTAMACGAGAWGTINPTYRRYTGLMRFHVDACTPRQPQRQGKVERRVHDHRAAIDPYGRSFRDLADLQAWTDMGRPRRARCLRGAPVQRAVPPCRRDSLALASALAWYARRPPFVHGIHRLVAGGAAEQRLGRSLAPDEALPRSLRGLHRLEARTMAAADGFILLTEAVRAAARAAFGIDRPAVLAPSGVDVAPSSPGAKKDVDVSLGRCQP